MSPKQTFFVLLQKILNMKRFLMIAALSVLLIGLGSCQKNKYCQCYAYVEGEDISLGEDLDVGAMTEEQIEAWNARDNYNLYIIEHGNCSDKAREITGWGQVTCREVDPKSPEGTWFERIYNQLFGGGHNNNSNNNNNNNSGNGGKP